MDDPSIPVQLAFRPFLREHRHDLEARSKRCARAPRCRDPEAKTSAIPDRRAMSKAGRRRRIHKHDKIVQNKNVLLLLSGKLSNMTNNTKKTLKSKKP